MDVRTSTAPAWAAIDLPELSLDQALAAAGAVLTADRIASVAVGSNASPAQMARKFAAQGVSGLVPMVVAQVTGVGVGFAAHVAAAGYVPTAPLPSDATQDLAVLLLDPSQVVALDATEPNYRRAVLDAARTEVVLPSGEVLTSVAVYAGERGMLGVGGDPLPYPRTQDQLLDELFAAVPALADTVGGHDASAFTAACRADPRTRERVRDVLVDAGLVLTHPHP